LPLLVCLLLSLLSLLLLSLSCFSPPLTRPHPCNQH
jgi:hypothetical protein